LQCTAITSCRIEATKSFSLKEQRKVFASNVTQRKPPSNKASVYDALKSGSMVGQLTNQIKDLAHPGGT
jgi:hypothetical protein